MQLAMPRQKALVGQIRPALVAVGVVIFGTIFIPVHYPVSVSNGVITPTVVQATDKVDVHWTQEWRDLCDVTVTREFVGSDGFRKTAAPYEFLAPKAKGTMAYSGTLIIPDLPVGEAYYHSVIQPHCWIDKIWQRTYKTPEIRLTMVRSTPAGPR